MEVKIKLKQENAQVPVFKHKGDACCDCYACESVSVNVNQRELVNLGFALELPVGYEAVIRPRSGLTSKGIDVAIGTIDSNYRGEVKACVINNSEKIFEIKSGDRICQMAIRKTEDVSFRQVDELNDTDRGEKGFGSSGIR